MKNTAQPGKNTSKKGFDLVKDYFLNSNEKLYAWLLLGGIVVCIVGFVALLFALSWWNATFWAVLAAKEMIPFLICMGQFTLLLASLVTAYVLNDYFIGQLSISWRTWFSNELINKLFYAENNYLDLERFSAEIDNIAQRIQDDVQTFVDLTLRLGADFLKSALSLGAFTGTLWLIGGSLSFIVLGLNIVIPGYLIWLSLIIAVAATAITHFIGKSLPEINKNAERAEANFRQSLADLHDEAENIAIENAGNYFKKSLEYQIQSINRISYQKLNTQTKLATFKSFYMQISDVLPYILAAPLYFSGLIELGVLMQVGTSFGQVSSALSWFVNAYENLAFYKTSIERITELQESFKKDGLIANSKSITRKVRDKESIKISHLHIMPPQASNTTAMMRNLNLKLNSGEHILIQGPSGLGKSTLFKAISGTWVYGSGKISIPARKLLYFLPQKPVLPYDTLRAVLAYPEPVSNYTEAQFIAVLRKVGGMDDFISKLDETCTWSNILSGGQKQRISFARVLLKKPDWIFLDEATASLDEESEEHVYQIVKELKNTTIVSIAHRSTVAKHHSRIVFFSLNPEKEIEVNEQRMPCILSNCSTP